MSPLFRPQAYPLASARRRSTLRLAATAALVAATAATAACGHAAPTDPTSAAAPRHHVRGDQTTTVDTTATDTTRTDSTGVHVLAIYENPMV